MAGQYLNKGDMATAHRFHDESLEHMFYANSEMFVSTYVRSGHRNLALLIAGFALLKDWKSRGFPPHCKPIGDDDFECGRL